MGDGSGEPAEADLMLSRFNIQSMFLKGEKSIWLLFEYVNILNLKI